MALRRTSWNAPYWDVYQEKKREWRQARKQVKEAQARLKQLERDVKELERDVATVEGWLDEKALFNYVHSHMTRGVGGGVFEHQWREPMENRR